MQAKDTNHLNGLRILVVDDEPHILKSIARTLAVVDCEVLLANSGAEALAILKKTPADIIISDMRMPNMSGDELLTIVAQQYPDTLRLVLTGYADLQSVVRAINQGRIWGYLEKPWNNENLLITLEQAIITQHILAERSILRKTLSHYQRQQRQHFHGFIGSSPAMQFIYKAIEHCAKSNASVFITGSSGTGKDVAAQAIHQESLRADKPFVAINCAAIPTELMESEIFGHIKGSFSGATNNREGAATQAKGGTLFFDEIGEMDISLQAKLLRFIQSGEFKKVGSDKVEKVDIRFICATNRDPLQAIEEKRLREDLYYRLNVISLHLPDLHERHKDALLIANHLLRHYSDQEEKIFIGLDKNAQMIVNNYLWPGNVRQLQNTIHSCVILSEGPQLTEETLVRVMRLTDSDVLALKKKATADFKSETPLEMQTTPLSQSSSMLPLHIIEQKHIENAILLFDGNIVKAAGALGVSPSTLYRKMQSWEQNSLTSNLR